MENTICKSISSLAIRKFIIKSIKLNTKDIKLIYIGNQSKKTKELLKKIEINEYNDNYNSNEIRKAIKEKDISLLLKSSEHKYLETIIPNYIKKIGDFENYNNFFIYTYIEDNLPIEHIRILLYETIKTDILPIIQQDDNLYLPYNMLIYHYPRAINFDYFTQLINFIFKKDSKTFKKKNSKDNKDKEDNDLENNNSDNDNNNNNNDNNNDNNNNNRRNSCSRSRNSNAYA